MTNFANWVSCGNINQKSIGTRNPLPHPHPHPLPQLNQPLSTNLPEVNSPTAQSRTFDTKARRIRRNWLRLRLPQLLIKTLLLTCLARMVSLNLRKDSTGWTTSYVSAVVKRDTWSPTILSPLNQKPRVEQLPLFLLLLLQPLSVWEKGEQPSSDTAGGL